MFLYPESVRCLPPLDVPVDRNQGVAVLCGGWEQQSQQGFEHGQSLPGG